MFFVVGVLSKDTHNGATADEGMEAAAAVDAGRVAGVPSSSELSAKETAADAALEAAKAGQAQWSDCVRCVKLVLELLTNLFTSDADQEEDDDDDAAGAGGAGTAGRTLGDAVHACMVEAGIPTLVSRNVGARISPRRQRSDNVVRPVAVFTALHTSPRVC